MYETIILKHFKNSIIIQSAKQLVFYDGTDFIVAGYRVKHLQHILDLTNQKHKCFFEDKISMIFFFPWML